MRSHADDHLLTHPDAEAIWLGTLAGRDLPTLLIEVFQLRLTGYSSSVSRSSLKVFGVCWQAQQPEITVMKQCLAHPVFLITAGQTATQCLAKVFPATLTRLLR